jgi:hypothetical protein
MVRIAALVQKRMLTTKIYFLMGLTEEFWTMLLMLRSVIKERMARDSSSSKPLSLRSTCSSGCQFIISTVLLHFFSCRSGCPLREQNKGFLGEKQL